MSIDCKNVAFSQPETEIITQGFGLSYPIYQIMFPVNQCIILWKPGDPRCRFMEVK